MTDPVNVNTRQIHEWNGAAGDSWSLNQDRFDAYAETVQRCSAGDR